MEAAPRSGAALPTLVEPLSDPYPTNRLASPVSRRLTLAHAETRTEPVVRMYVAAHLPLDLIGGAALGVFVASAVSLGLRAPRRATAEDP